MQEITNAYFGRASRFEEAWNIFLNNPVFGNCKVDEINYYDIRYREMRTGGIHSLYLYILAKTGIVGFTLFLFFLYKMICFTIRTVNFSLNREMKMYSEGATVTIFAMLISGFSSTRILSIESFLFLGILLGVLTNIWRFTKIIETNSNIKIKKVNNSLNNS